MRRLLPFFVLAMLLSMSVLAQERLIRGTVTNSSDGTPAPGVSVVVKGTNIGVSTDAQGAYSIRVPEGGSVLVFRAVGSEMQEVSIGSRTVIDVAMRDAAQNLSEVVVTGLASSIKRSNTANSVASISGETLAGKTNPVTLDAALAGKFAGALISQTSGAPGGGVSVQLRGISTITGASQPLYVIDGVIADNSVNGNGAGSAYFTGASSGVNRTSQDNTVNRISDINPADIENIEILKGPSAAAIYGTRANAGVILITTKKGKAGETKVNFSQDFGFTQANRLIGKSDWTEDRVNTLYGSASELALFRNALAAGKFYDYEKEIYGNTGTIIKSRLSVSGGNDRTRFYVAGNFMDEDGIVNKTGAENNSVRVNVDHKLGSIIDLASSSNYINTRNQRSFFGNDNNGISIPYALAYIPSYHELHQNPDGSYPDEPQRPENPLAIIDRAVNDDKSRRFIQSLSATVRLLQGNNYGLKLVSNGGFDFYLNEGLVALPSDLQSQLSLAPSVRGISRLSKAVSLNTNLQGLLVFNYSPGSGRTNLTTQAGVVRLTTNRELSFTQGRGMIAGQLNPLNSGVRDLNVRTLRSEDQGVFFQQEANFGDKLIATAGLRLDRSSLLSDSEKFYAFPKASLALNVANFDFWKFEPVNQLKLRAAYGESGGVPNFGDNYYEYEPQGIGGSLGIRPTLLLGLDNLQPETSKELELGVDLGLFGDKVTLEATYYNKEVHDILNPLVIARSTGVASVAAYPLGDLRNRGMELTLGYKPVNGENFKWNGYATFYANRSKVIKSNVPVQVIGDGFGDAFGVNIWAEGESPSRWWGRPNNQAGNPGGYTRYGDAQPDFQVGFGNNINFLKQFDFSFLMHWKQGGYNCNILNLMKDEGGTAKDWEENGLRRLGLFGRNLDEYIESTTYVRLREVSLYYTLTPAQLSKTKFIKGLRVGVSGNNLFTITNYSGYDPEVSNFGNVANGAGVDLGSFPNTRRMFFHLSVDF